MRTKEAILENKSLRNISFTDDGGHGDIHIGGWDGSVVFSWGAGWEHVSVHPYVKRIMPSWDDMCKLKDIFFEDSEAVIQIHPPKDQYVSNLNNCLHLWRCSMKEMVLPPSCLVGIRKGQTPSELRAEILKAYEEAGKKYE